jgi:transposase
LFQTRRNTDLTNEQREVLEPLIHDPVRRPDGRGGPWQDPRDILNGILWVLRAGAHWHDLPERYPPYQTTHVDVHGDHLVVSVRGRELAMTFLSDLRIPLEHVQGVEADPEIEHTLWRGWRIPGVHLPGVRFYDVHGHRDKTIVIHLKDETYDRLIVEVPDPVEVVTKVNEALDAARRS